MTPEEAIDDYLGEWIKGLPPKGAPQEWYKMQLQQPHVILETNAMWNSVSTKGDRSLDLGARLLLQQLAEQRCVRLSSARRALIEAHVAHTPKAKRTGRLSEHAVVAGAKKRIANLPRQNGAYIVPVVFSPYAKNSNLDFGPARVISRAKMDKFADKLIQDSAKVDDFTKKMAPRWRKYAKSYDHFIVVDIIGHEAERAIAVAREVAEVVLNTIRMAFGYYHTRNIRLGDGFIWETQRTRLYLDRKNVAQLSFSSGPWGSLLEDDWVKKLQDILGGHIELIASVAGWVASGRSPGSPILERLSYANTLIAEAYSEPHDHIRLVRLIAALETLAVLPREDKSHSLAMRCAFAGGWSKCEKAVQIHDAVVGAYQLRNAIVHGDAPARDDVMASFYRLEKHLAWIYLGFLYLYLDILQNTAPTHIRHFRRAVSEQIEMFFWML